ncbi:MAG: hypothetical protein ACMXX8_00750, partial [Candidatus Woesearchaeota archaeon]
GAAALIGLIGLFIILYILFLPADIRDDILKDNDDENEISYGVEGKVVLEETPGKLDLINLRHCVGRECSHKISSFRLFMTTDATEIESFNPFIIKNNILKKEFQTLNFELSNIDYIDNLLLSFNTYHFKGILTIILNGNTIYEKEINTFNPEPIKLPKEILSRNNNLEFQVSNVGWRFWDTNEIRFENMKISGDITDVSRQESNNIFYLSDSEFNNIERGRLSFSPDCSQSNIGPLQISLNNRDLYYSIPDCNDLNVVEFPPAFFNKGENIIKFKTDMGAYFVDLIEIRTWLKEITYPVYYFNLKKEDLNHIKNEKLNLTANFEFVSHSTAQGFEPEEADRLHDQNFRVIMTLNGYSREIISPTRTFSRMISYEDLREENNWIRLEPRSTHVEISTFKLKLIPT